MYAGGPEKGGDYYATVSGDKLAEVLNSTYQRSVPGMVNLSLIEEVRKYLVGRKMFSQRNSPRDTDTKQVYTESYLLSGTVSRKDDVSGRSFARSFSFADPRIKAGAIENPVWRAIQRGAPLKNMMTKEYELAMGKPTRRLEHLDKDQYNDFYYERHHGKSWRVEFKNGVLNKYITLE